MALFLVTPSSVNWRDIESFRQEFIDAGSKLHGSSGLLQAKSVEDWFRNRLWQRQGHSMQFFSYCTYAQQYVGCIRLTPLLPNTSVFSRGLHIGYSIRPSMRNQGYGTRQLQEGLNILRDMGIRECAIAADPGSPVRACHTQV